MSPRVFSVLALCAVLFECSLASPAADLVDNKRVQRSPQFGFPVVNEYPQYPVGGGLVAPGGFAPPVVAPLPLLPGAAPAVLPGALPGALPGVLGQPGLGVYPQRQGASEAVATANAGSLNLGGGLGGIGEEQSHASSHSASFNLGPLSASFSNSDAGASEKQIF